MVAIERAGGNALARIIVGVGYRLDCQATNPNAMTAATIAETGITGPVCGAATAKASPPTASAVATAMTVLAHSGNFVRSILCRPSGSMRRSYVVVDGCRLPDRATLDAPISVQWLGAMSGSPPYRRHTGSF
jgi:hypothetical protein